MSNDSLPDDLGSDSHTRKSVAAFPIRLKRSRALEGDPEARAKAESQQRYIWVHELRERVMAANLPVVRVVQASRDPHAIAKVLAPGRRISTIRRRVLDWKIAAHYFTLVANCSWPRGIHDVLDYLHPLRDAGQPPSALDRASHALMFMERASSLQFSSCCAFEVFFNCCRVIDCRWAAWS